MVYTHINALTMENHHPSTLLSMDSSVSSHEELDLEMNNRQSVLSGPPDINLPLSAELSPPPQPWNPDACDILDPGLGSQAFETENYLSFVPRVGRKYSKRVDSIWGAWFFFSFYFKPALNEKSKTKIIRDNNGVSGFDKSDIKLEVFLVQHDMENIYMWIFRERPENALGKMQLRSYMNGHSRQGERLFPFTVEKGFVRSHRMQRKHYRGLSNPQCVHGIELIPGPNLKCLDEEEKKRWIELTGRDLNFTIPPEASDFSSWRNLSNTDFELKTPPLKNLSASNLKKLLNGSSLNLSTNEDLSPVSHKRRKGLLSNVTHESDCCLTANLHSSDTEVHRNSQRWSNEFSGAMKNACGPVTAAKSIYEDEQGYLVVISLPFVDPHSIKVSWRNTFSHGIIKVSCVSTSRVPLIKRCDRTFHLIDVAASEHCPPGKFIREVSLSTRIPEDAEMEACFDGPASVLEILVPKLRSGTEEHEVRVCLLRTHLDMN